MTDEELMASMEIDDSYHVVRVLAQHKVGVTELVRSPEGRLCVRKRLPRELANREAWEALRGLRSPLIPRVEQLYELPDALVVISPYVAGTSVGELLESGVRMAPLEAISVIEGVCDALAILHAAGIIHRDVSPGNVIIAPDVGGGSLRSRVRLIDLGVARVSKSQASHDTKPLGTMGFSAPEQYGFAQTDARSDLYSAGRLLLCLLCGSIVDDVAPDLDELMRVQGIPDPLRDVVTNACAFEPSARYQSARQMVIALEYAERTLNGAAQSADTVRPAGAAQSAGIPGTGEAAYAHGPSVPVAGGTRPAPGGARGGQTGVAPQRASSTGIARKRALRALMYVTVLAAVWFVISLIYALVARPLSEYYGVDFVMVVFIAGLVGIAWMINSFLQRDAASPEPLRLAPLALKIVGVVALTFAIVFLVAIITAALKLAAAS